MTEKNRVEEMVQRLTSRKEQLKHNREELSKPLDPEDEEKGSDSVMSVIKEAMPEVYEGWKFLYNETTSLHTTLVNAMKDKRILKTMAEVKTQKREWKKYEEDVWFKYDEVLKRGDIAEALKQLDLATLDFETMAKKDPDALSLLVNTKADDREQYAFLKIKDLSGASKSDKIYYAEKGRIPKEAINDYFDQMSTLFDDVRSLEGEKPDEVLRLLDKYETWVPIKNELLDIADTNRAARYLEVARMRGYAKQYKELKDQLGELTDDIMEKEGEKKVVDSDLEAKKKELTTLESAEKTMRDQMNTNLQLYNNAKEQADALNKEITVALARRQELYLQVDDLNQRKKKLEGEVGAARPVITKPEEKAAVADEKPILNPTQKREGFRKRKKDGFFYRIESNKGTHSVLNTKGSTVGAVPNKKYDEMEEAGEFE